jgi:4a-hydroxytetrahydrobiopterin dehydratase
LGGRGRKKIEQKFKFKYFKEAMVFVNKIAELAESEGHHPDIEISYNKVEIELTTHAIGGLSTNDFILASKIELLV